MKRSTWAGIAFAAFFAAGVLAACISGADGKTPLDIFYCRVYMENMNHNLFLLLNAPAHPDPRLVYFARGLAEGVIWLIPLILTAGWLWGSRQHRAVMLEGAAAGLAGLLTNQIIGLFWQHPRPFMINLGHTFLQHPPDSSFPSDHLTLLWSVAFSLALHKRVRLAGFSLALMGLPVAWARIYLGVHFPMDMAGAALVALACAGLMSRGQRQLIATCYPPLLAAYHLLAGPLIQRGWIAE